MRVETVEIERIMARHTPLFRDGKLNLKKIVSVFDGEGVRVVVDRPSVDGVMAIYHGCRAVKEAKDRGDKTIMAIVLDPDEALF